MAGNSIEIEMQAQIERPEKLLAFLKENAKFVYESHQIDQYYLPPHRNFFDEKPIREWLRLRSEGEKASINYKNWHYDDEGKSHHCDEYESKISDKDELGKLLSALNFKVCIKVDKKRQAYRYKNYEICLDSVKELGDFVEIEFSGVTNKAPKEITTEMEAFLNKIGVGKIERNYKGYPYLLLEEKKII